MQMTPPFMAGSEEALKSFLMKEESEKADLKLNIQETKIMPSGPITSWQIDGKTYFWAPKSLQMVTAAMKLKDACSLEEKLMTKLDSILKSRDITLPTKVRLSRLWFFQ